MSKKPKVKSPAKAGTRAPAKSGGDLNFGTRNYAALGIALACILLGFYLLSTGSITAAPILLVLGYCVLIPYGLATGSKA